MAINFEQIVVDFWDYVNKYNIKIYNEFSLQHELGIYLRKQKSLQGYAIEFERNISSFGITNTRKHEIDIVIYDEAKLEKYAIELKFPRKGSGAHNVEMFSFIEDIKFIEQLVRLRKSSFTNAYSLVLVENDAYYIKKSTAHKITKYFRNTNARSISIPKRTRIDYPVNSTNQNKKIPKPIFLYNKYSVAWEDPKLYTSNKELYNGGKDCRYYLIKAEH